MDADSERQIDLTAAEWLVRRDRGFIAAEQEGFSQWLAENPRHGEWLSRHDQTWRDFDLLARRQPEHGTKPDPDLLAPPRLALRWHWPAMLAAAAGVALALSVWRSWAPHRTDSSVAVAATPAIERRVLEDGSTVELNRGAVIEVEFTPAERRVRLVRGEALFAVAKNPLRPFIVRAHGVDVRAVGTAFDVRLETESVAVLVTEGHVQVRPPTSSVPVLAAGQRTVVSFSPTAPPPQVLEVSPEEMEGRLAWQPELFDFSSTPLAQVVAEFNRHATGPHDVHLSIADAQLGTLPIVASIRSDNIEGFIRLLELTAGVHAERRGENEIVLHKDR